VILDAEDPATPQRLRRTVREHALAGLRLTGAPSADNTYPWLNSPQALRSWEVADAAGLVVDIMITNEDNSAYGIPAIIQLAKAQYRWCAMESDAAPWPTHVRPCPVAPSTPCAALRRGAPAAFRS
jgi:hypothetical protein